MIDYVHEYEKTKPKQHPVGMTFQYKAGSNRTLFDSPADWISPNPDGGYRDNPPAADGSKVIVSDTDHLWGIGGNRAWVWKSFLRGLNPIFMDPYDGLVLGKRFDPKWDPIRKSMGDARRLADRVDLAAMTPQNKLASTGYCLAHAAASGDVPGLPARGRRGDRRPFRHAGPPRRRVAQPGRRQVETGGDRPQWEECQALSSLSRRRRVAHRRGQRRLSPRTPGRRQHHPDLLGQGRGPVAEVLRRGLGLRLKPPSRHCLSSFDSRGPLAARARNRVRVRGDTRNLAVRGHPTSLTRAEGTVLCQPRVERRE